METGNVGQPFNPWPWSIMGFFAVAMVAAVGWVTFCIFNGQELVAADYYEREVVHQQQMERAQRGLALGGRAAIAYVPEVNRILVRVPVEQLGSGVVGAIELYRPSEAGLDQKVILAPGADGVQWLDASGLKPGLWRVKLMWTAAGEEHFLDEKVQVVASAS